MLRYFWRDIVRDCTTDEVQYVEERLCIFACKLPTGEYINIYVISTLQPLEAVEHLFPRHVECFCVYLMPEEEKVVMLGKYRDDSLNKRIEDYLDNDRIFTLLNLSAPCNDLIKELKR